MNGGVLVAIQRAPSGLAESDDCQHYENSSRVGIFFRDTVFLHTSFTLVEEWNAGWPSEDGLLA